MEFEAPADVLTYWFGSAPATDIDAFKSKLRRWYQGTPEIDGEIQGRFGLDVEAAASGRLDPWANEPRPCLALVLLLDQFTRNIYRGTPRAYALDPKAQGVALAGYARGFEDALGLEERLFFMMPLIHAEDLALQARARETMARLAADAPPELREAYAIGVREAARHRDEIARFGRFPARNAILGRTPAAEETDYLAALARAGAPY
jgi:uncharacterized protein (DUF924 family)